MNLVDTMTFFKTAGKAPAIIGSLWGGAFGAGLQRGSLKAKTQEGLSRGQDTLKREIAKQKLEVKFNPTPRTHRRLKELEISYRVATFFAKHPAAATLGSAGAGAVVGGLAGRRISKL